MPYGRTQYYEGEGYTLLYNSNEDIGCGKYMDIDGENDVKVFGVILTSKATDKNGVEFSIIINKFYK